MLRRSRGAGAAPWLLLVPIFFATPSVLGQLSTPCAGDRTLENQEDVERLASHLASSGCTTIGGLQIRHDVNDLLPLRNLTEIEYLSLWDVKHLRSLDGLEGLHSIGGKIQIGSAPELTSLRGLRHVKGPLYGSLYMKDVPSLQTLEGLHGITEVEFIYLQELQRLESLDGLRGLSYISWHVEGYRNSISIKGLPKLRSLRGLHNLRGELLGGIWLDDLPKLESVEALQRLTGMHGWLDITSTAALSSLEGLGGILHAEGWRLRTNSGLKSLGALQLQVVDNDVIISGNDALTSLEGMGKITTIGRLEISENKRLRSVAGFRASNVSIGSLEIKWNPMLRSLHGLEAMRGAKEINIYRNEGLKSIDALANIRGAVEKVDIQRNPSLTSVESLLFFESVTKTFYIRDNSLQCITKAAESKMWDMSSPAPHRVVPPARNVGLCKACEKACGNFADNVVHCDRDYGHCRCPLGRHGPNCASTYPHVFVREGQVLRCTRPPGRRTSGRSSSRVCNVEVELRMQQQSSGKEVYEPRSLAASLSCGSSNCSARDVHLGKDSEVVWANRTHGSLKARLTLGFGEQFEENLKLEVRIGYPDNTYPDNLLGGTLAEPPRTPSLPLYPSCIDSGDCQQHSNISMQVVVVGHEPDCDPGEYSSGMACIACPDGHAALEGSRTCTRCGRWRYTDKDQALCYQRWFLIASLVGGFASLTMGLVVLSLQVRIEWTGWFPSMHPRRLLIDDIALEKNQTVVTIAQPHKLRRRAGSSVPATFRGTCHPGLEPQDCQRYFRVRVLDSDRLELQDERGGHLVGVDGQPLRLDTSTGEVVVPLWQLLWYTGRPMPVAVAGPCLVLAGLGLLIASSLAHQGEDSAYDEDSYNDVFVVAAAAACALAVVANLVASRGRARPSLALEVDAFKEKLRRDTEGPQRVERGPGRALQAGQLDEFYAYFRRFLRDRSMYYVVSNIVKPLTAEHEVSYSELVGPSQIMWFVSHFWGHKFCELVEGVRRHAEGEGGAAWARQSYWICSFSNNQYRVKEELGGSWSDSSFYIALRDKGCCGTCLIVDEAAKALERSWCLFELVQTEIASGDRADFKGLLFCSHTGVVNYGQASFEVSVGLAGFLAKLDLESASATCKNDQDMIKAFVIQQGGFHKMNQVVRRRVHAALDASEAAANAKLADLRAELSATTVATTSAVAASPASSSAPPALATASTATFSTSSTASPSAASPGPRPGAPQGLLQHPRLLGRHAVGPGAAPSLEGDKDASSAV